MSLTSNDFQPGTVMGRPCPVCGGELYRNVGGMFICKKRDCGWRSYSFEPVPQPEKEVTLGEPLTSSQQYFAKLQDVFNYGKRQLQRQKRELGNIRIIRATPHYISIVYHPGGGVHSLPAPPAVDCFVTSSGVGIKETNFDSTLTYPKLVVNIDANSSGRPLPIDYHLKDAAYPQANA